jgi:hypothetical protein
MFIENASCAMRTPAGCYVLASFSSTRASNKHDEPRTSLRIATSCSSLHSPQLSATSQTAETTSFIPTFRPYDTNSFRASPQTLLLFEI